MRESMQRENGPREIATQHHQTARSWSPFEAMRRMFAEMDPLFDVHSGWSPEMAIETANGHLHMRVNLPGVSPEDIAVEVDRRVLTVSGVRHQSREDAHGSMRSFGSFTRQVRLPDNVDENTVHARYENGMLEVTMDVHKTTGRRIDIEHGRAETKKS